MSWNLNSFAAPALRAVRRLLDQTRRRAGPAAETLARRLSLGARQFPRQFQSGAPAAAPAAPAAPRGSDDPETMQASLAGYIWRHSRADQLLLLAVTFATFPLLYASLELPKLIINDAISAETDAIAVFGFELTRVEYLLLLCFGFLGAVLSGGLLKMRLNTMKGVVAERLLRRFRFQLIARTLRFPLPYFQRTSQGELISMVTAEAEPLGGAMGDLVAQPVFQAGQMLTIVAFLFIQNVWLGLAAVALIPVQAWLIPFLQRRINTLHKQRVQEVRRLSARFGETIAGVEDLRVNNGARFALADFSSRLGTLFSIRLQIYKKKYFMKFLNNFITQITPFFFFAIGGYLVIQGQLTVGALVAALAAYKDLSSPWRELLTYYTQIQELSLRYRTIIEQFGPTGMVPARLFDGAAEAPPRLTGPISVTGATVREQGGAAVLRNLNFELPAGGMVAIQSRSASERRALTQLLSRAITPSQGRVRVGDVDLGDLHQSAISARIGVVGGAPYLFNATIWDNVGMALRAEPQVEDAAVDPEALRQEVQEAMRVGAPGDPVDVPWLDPRIAGVEDAAALRAWWLRIVEAIGTDDYLFQRGLDRPFDGEAHPELAERLVALRGEARFRIRAAGLDRVVHWFNPERFNPGLAIAGNLLFAAPKRRLRAEDVAEDARFLPAIREEGLEPDLLALGGDLLTVLTGAFGSVGPSHPLFQRLGLGAELFARLQRVAEKRSARGAQALSEEDRALMMALPFQLTAEQIGQAFPEALKSKILQLRRARSEELRQRAVDIFAPLERDRFVEGLTALENLLYGKIAVSAAPMKIEKLRAAMIGLIEEAGLKGDIALLIADEPAGVAGSQLDPVAHERIAFVRAAIKRPDVLILDRPMASHALDDRLAMRGRIRALLPDATLVFLEPEVIRPNDFDLVLEIEDGTTEEGAGEGAETDPAGAGGADLIRKRRVVETCAPFRDLARSQIRLLAYASQWFEAEAGEYMFRQGDPTDGAFVLTKGRAELRWTGPEDGAPHTVSVVEPGRLIGDLSVILGSERNLDMVAITPVAGIRIGAEELRDVIHSDAAVAVSLLETVSHHLVSSADRLRAFQAVYPDPRKPDDGPPSGTSTDHPSQGGAVSPSHTRGRA